MDIAIIIYHPEIPYQTYYKQFWAAFPNNLRKRGDQLVYKDNTALTADEIVTPTLEASTVLWALEKIDPRLPWKVKKNYGHQMVGHQCLMSLQPTIFQNFGSMLVELDEAESASVARCIINSGECIYLTPRPTSSKQQPTYRNRGAQGYSKRPRQHRQNKKLFCRICYHAGAFLTTYSSHSISSCLYLTKADRADLRKMNVKESREMCLRTESFAAPGWDSNDNHDSEAYDTECDEINIRPYTMSCNSESQRFQTNALIVQIGMITPVSSQIIEVQFRGSQLPITLDSGATLSFIRRDWADKLNIQVMPNTQLETLADQLTTIQALGEIDIMVGSGQYELRLLAQLIGYKHLGSEVRTFTLKIVL